MSIRRPGKNFTSDHLGNERGLTSTNGTVVYRGEYDPHGQMIYEWSSSGEYYKNSHKYTGYERDWATNLDNAKARTFNHNRGRFMQADPLGVGAADVTNPQSLNRYSYVLNDPVNLIDPTGLLPRVDCQFTGSVDGGSVYTCRWIDEPDFGGIGEPKPGGGGEEEVQKTGCETFVDKIVNFAMGNANHVGLDGTPDGGAIVANSLEGVINFKRVPPQRSLTSG